MKRFKLLVLTFLLILSTLSPMTVHAEGNGNINNGGGGLGEGTDTNFWNTGDEGVRVTVVSASDGSAVSASIDLTNKQPNDIRVQFGKVCKSQYRSGTVLTPDTGSYSYINPTQSLPKIITTSSGSASLAAIKSYFTDEQVIRSIAGYVGMNYDTLIGGDYKLLLEPIAYVTFEGVRTAFTATEAAMYNQVRGGMLRKKLTSLTHKNLPLAMFLETSDLGYPAWGGGKNQKVSDDEIIGSLGLGIVRFNEVVTPEVIAADYEYRVDTDVVKDQKYVGRMCYGTIGGDLRARVEFVTLGVSDHYAGIKASIINRKEGVVDSVLLRFTDIWGKQKVSNPNFKEGMNPHIWTNSGKSEWYVFHPGQAEYRKAADTVENYLSIFQDMAMTQESQDCTMQMGT